LYYFWPCQSRGLSGIIPLSDKERRVPIDQHKYAYNQQLAAQAPADTITTTKDEVLRGQAIDGKNLRGVRAHGQPLALVHLVQHGSGTVLEQTDVAEKSNEITAVPALLAGRDLSNTLLTMDALLTQRERSQHILEQRGHYLMVVKENQPTLYQAIALLFDQPPWLPSERAAEYQVHRTIEVAAPIRAPSIPITPVSANDFVCHARVFIPDNGNPPGYRHENRGTPARLTGLRLAAKLEPDTPLPMTNAAPSSHLSFTDAQEVFRQSLQARNAAARTIQAYRQDVRQFRTWLHRQIALGSVHQVQREDIEAFLAYLGQQGTTGTSRRRKLCALRQFFACLEDHGYLTTAPTEGVARPKAEERTPQILYSHEYKALLYEARAKPRDQAILQVFLQAGLRVGELCALTGDNLDLRARELLVRQSKGRQDRVIPLSEEVCQAVQAYLAVRPPADTPHLFLTKYGTSLEPRAVNYMLQKYVHRAGIHKQISVHTLRHTCATHRADKGMPLRSLQAMLGHRSLETTYRYLHLARSSLRQEVEATAL